jgi:hypothetical protein
MPLQLGAVLTPFRYVPFLPVLPLSSVNHPVLERSERPEQRGETLAELLTGAAHRHWLELLGFDRFTRPA